MLFAFLQHEVSQEEDNIVHEDDISLSITEMPPEYDSLTMDIIHSDYKGELELEGCLPRYPL